MNFKEIISTTRKYNFHSHTQFCDGHAPISVMAAAAVSCGMEHYGFTPHSPIPISSPCNMSADDVDAYFAEVDAMRRRYADSRCRFYTSMEIDYLNDQCGPADSYFQNLPLDYRLASVHFIPTQDGDFVDIDGKYEHFRQRMKDCFRNDIEWVVGTYFEQEQKMIASGGFDILGHFDKVAQNASYHVSGIEDSQFYRGMINSLIDTIIESGLSIELNTKARIDHGRFFPSEQYLPRLIAGQTTIIVNSDAHDPEKIEASRNEAFAILDRYAQP